jgi:acetyl/propionyl-CoA carboxylase alpha subunit
MPITRLLIANRAEIAIRIARAAADLGVTSVAVYSTGDAASLHVRTADDARELPGRGAAAYLDAAALIAAAKATGCDAIHPGYGFLSERPDFARQCADAGLLFVGPHLRIWSCSATRPVRVRPLQRRKFPCCAAWTTRFPCGKRRNSSPRCTAVR